MYPADPGPTSHHTSNHPPQPLSDPTLPDPSSLPPPLPAAAATIPPRRVTLRDRQTVATILPVVSAPRQLPRSLVAYLCRQVNREIEGGDTYPMTSTFSVSAFSDFWFHGGGDGTLSGVMLLGDFAAGADSIAEQQQQHDDDDEEEGEGDGSSKGDERYGHWARTCLGSFYIRARYPGRGSHVCGGGLLVTDQARRRGAGRLMGEAYLDWAPRLGFTHSVFDLVYETNVASCRIWDALGFRRVGRVRAAGRLRSYPDRLVDAIIYGRDLPPPPPSPSSPPVPTSSSSSSPKVPQQQASDTNEPGGAMAVSSAAAAEEQQRFDRIRFYLKFDRYPDGADRAEKSRLRSAATHYKLVPAATTTTTTNKEGDEGGEEETLMLKDRLVVADPERQQAIVRATHGRHHGGINKTTALVAEKYHWSRIKDTVSDVIRLCAHCKELARAAAPPAVAGTKRSRSPSVLPPRSRIRAQPDPPYPSLDDLSVAVQTLHAAPGVLPPVDAADHDGDALRAPPAVVDVYQPIDPRIMSRRHDDHLDDAFGAYHPQDFQALLHAAAADDDGADDDGGRRDGEDGTDRDLEMLIEHGIVDVHHDDHGGGSPKMKTAVQTDGEMDDLDVSVLQDSHGWT